MTSHCFLSSSPKGSGAKSYYNTGAPHPEDLSSRREQAAGANSRSSQKLLCEGRKKGPPSGRPSLSFRTGPSPTLLSLDLPNVATVGGRLLWGLMDL